MRRIDRRNPDGKDGEKLSNGEDVVKLFLSHDRDFWATESILVATVERLPSCGTETLQLLLQRDSGAGVKEAVVESVKDPEIMRLLLKHRPMCPITQDVVCIFLEEL